MSKFYCLRFSCQEEDYNNYVVTIAPDTEMSMKPQAVQTTNMYFTSWSAAAAICNPSERRGRRDQLSSLSTRFWTMELQIKLGRFEQLFVALKIPPRWMYYRGRMSVLECYFYPQSVAWEMLHHLLLRLHLKCWTNN